MGTQKNDLWIKRDTSSKTPVFYPVKYYLLDLLPEWLGGKPLYLSVWDGNFIQNDLELEAFLFDQLQMAEYKGLTQHAERINRMLAKVHRRLDSHSKGEDLHD